ncbi:unnamed protein product [Amoebophrya sp. A25]|nr:unnamed protein product [Amoebophrya sp. A25]|eukprot:GSA25T00026504001.1
MEAVDAFEALKAGEEGNDKAMTPTKDVAEKDMDSEMKDMKDAKDDKGMKDMKAFKMDKSEKDAKDMKMPKDKYKLKDQKEKAPKKEKVIKPVKKTGGKGKKRAATRESWNSYIHKVLKSVHDDNCTLSSKAMVVLDSFAHDLFDRLSREAIKLLRINNKKTLTSMEVQTAARLVLPGDLCKHAIQDGTKAVAKYSQSTQHLRGE